MHWVEVISVCRCAAYTIGECPKCRCLSWCLHVVMCESNPSTLLLQKRSIRQTKVVRSEERRVRVSEFFNACMCVVVTFMHICGKVHVVSRSNLAPFLIYV